MTARKIAIVTGGNRGLGLEIARQLMKSDLFVVVGARDRAKCEAALAALASTGANAEAFPLDVNDTKSVRRFVEEVDKKHGAPGVLVNNAGVYPEETDAKVVDTPTSMWRETLETNLFGAVRMCREVVPLMKKLRYGRIVNMSSGLGQLQTMGEGSPAYRVSKAALNALTRTLAAEVAGHGILVNSMSPGWVRTDMGGDDAPRSVEEGADTAVWLSLLPSNGPTGQFFRDRKPIPW
jgi:NAD(P)-dependent dehydrogenase (short-subunit alcohol dehydrogenase family)